MNLITKVKQARSANIIDILRFAGCFCVVWYHSGFFWALSPDHQAWVNTAKLLTISWAMPFFYITTAYFSLAGAQSFRTAANRIISAGLLLAGYTLFYYFYFHPLNVHTLSAIDFGAVFNIYSSGANTPCYFLWHVMAIQFIAYLVVQLSAFVPGKKAGWLYDLGVCAIALFSVSPWLDHFYELSHINADCVLASCFVYVAAKYENKWQAPVSKYDALAVAFSLILLLNIYGYCAHGAAWEWMSSLGAILISIGFIPLYKKSRDVFTGEDFVAAKLAVMGQLLSLGIFLIHQYGLMAAERLVAGWFRAWHIDDIVIYVSINLIGFALALGLTMALNAFCPFLVSISRRDWIKRAASL